LNRRDPGLRAGPELVKREPSSISGAAGAGLADTPERLAMGAQMLALQPATVADPPPFDRFVTRPTGVLSQNLNPDI
jgi:hypothetical protein